jgi:protein arginine N-methyltransferase 3
VVDEEMRHLRQRFRFAKVENDMMPVSRHSGERLIYSTYTHTMSSIASDDGCSDWASDIGEPTQSLFAGEAPSAREALEADRAAGYDLAREAERLGLDTYGRMRLINLVRRDKLSMAQAKALERGDWADDDALLVPVVENDPLLLESWESDDEDGDEGEGEAQLQDKGKGKGKEKEAGEDVDVGDLAAQLARARLDLDAAQKVVKGVLGDDEPVEVKRDDDTHYFDSYADNGGSCGNTVLSNTDPRRHPRNHAARYHPHRILRPLHPLEPHL